MKPMRWLFLAVTLVALSACIVAPGRGYYGHPGGGWHDGYRR